LNEVYGGVSDSSQVPDNSFIEVRIYDVNGKLQATSVAIQVLPAGSAPPPPAACLCAGQ